MDNKELQTEQKIFKAAAEVFEEKGLDGSRMQQIADRAGINKSLLHYYYRSKEKLFKAVFSLVAKNMFKKMIHFFSDPNMNLEEKIRFFYREHITFLQKNPYLPAFLINEINRNPDLIRQLFESEEFVHARNLMKEQYARDVESGNFLDYRPIHLFINIVSMSVFPFAARGIIQFIMNEEGLDFNEEMEKRKTMLPQFVLKALKN